MNKIPSIQIPTTFKNDLKIPDQKISEILAWADDTKKQENKKYITRIIIMAIVFFIVFIITSIMFISDTLYTLAVILNLFNCAIFFFMIFFDIFNIFSAIGKTKAFTSGLYYGKKCTILNKSMYGKNVFLEVTDNNDNFSTVIIKNKTSIDQIPDSEIDLIGVFYQEKEFWLI